MDQFHCRTTTKARPRTWRKYSAMSAVREILDLYSRVALHPCRNAIGQRRLRDGTDTSGKLVTGEKFQGVSGLREIIAGPRKKDFHRCLTEKLLTYALGRGVEYYDSPAVQGIIKQAEQAGGGLREFIYALAESAPFQKRRGQKQD